MIKNFNIYWCDLTEECQQKLNKFIALNKLQDDIKLDEPLIEFEVEIEDPKVENKIQ